MIGELTDGEIERILHEQVIGRIGCHARGRTYVVPITYAYIDHAIVSHTGNGQKVQMMRENPDVCFEVEDLRYLPRWSSVILRGRYEELADKAGEAALDALVDRLGATPPPLSSMPWQGAGVYEAGSHVQRFDVMFRITIEERSGRYDR